MKKDNTWTLSKAGKLGQSIMQPPYLKKGDTIAIVAPARKINLEEIKPSIDLLTSWELKVKLSKNIFCSYNQFAGSDEERAEDMQWALDTEEIKAIFCARGGYGCVRMMDRLSFSRFKKSPKWLVGFSDITVFHSHLSNMKIASMHAAMPFNISKLIVERKGKEINDSVALATLKDALFGKSIKYKIESHSLNRKGKAHGVLIGGNLSILYSLSGTSSDIDTSGKILFIEDLDEYLYHIDRMMFNLKRSGKLKNLIGLIVGGMTDMKDNKVAFNKTAEQIISEAVAEYKYPVCYNFPAGHITGNSALKMGTTILLEVNAQYSKIQFQG